MSVFIASAVRTPVGSFRKSLASVSATQLGATGETAALPDGCVANLSLPIVVQAAIDRAGGNLSVVSVQEVVMGNVLSAGLRQSPARQAALLAGCPVSTEATTINKVCASGLKAIALGAQAVALGYRDVVVAGGMESMSNVPFYLPRGTATYGNVSLVDGIIGDGLSDAYSDVHMGVCAEETATEYGISREAQDAHAVESYRRAADAWAQGKFATEIAQVVVRNKKNGDVPVTKDEEYTNVNFDKIPNLKSVFVKGGSVTAANSSTLNDGASAVVLVSEAAAAKHSLKPIAKIISYADAATDPKRFTIAPSLAIPIALAKAGIAVKDVDLWEINEAFSVVVRVNEEILGLDASKVNINGGGVSLGHPIGSSGSRIVVSLVHALKPGQLGVAAICNGGGGATAMVVQRL
ncbi:erg10, acetyl-CoA C-acetyltransferase [Entophlyctis sp. JEL0112]|nr:erg10, acetyl-CoA C-acetyltransferase [Entophlyctis sp. JEL0112]